MSDAQPVRFGRLSRASGQWPRRSVHGSILRPAQFARQHCAPLAPPPNAERPADSGPRPSGDPRRSQDPAAMLGLVVSGLASRSTVADHELAECPVGQVRHRGGTDETVAVGLEGFSGLLGGVHGLIMHRGLCIVKGTMQMFDPPERWHCTAGRLVQLRAVLDASWCDDWFHEDDGSVCRHPKPLPRKVEERLDLYRRPA